MCPLIEKADARCAEHLTLDNLVHAFTICAGNYRACPIYQRLKADEYQSERIDAHRELLAAS